MHTAGRNVLAPQHRSLCTSQDSCPALSFLQTGLVSSVCSVGTRKPPCFCRGSKTNPRRKNPKLFCGTCPLPAKSTFDLKARRRPFKGACGSAFCLVQPRFGPGLQCEVEAALGCRSAPTGNGWQPAATSNLQRHLWCCSFSSELGDVSLTTGLV